jgi:dimethylargininase
MDATSGASHIQYIPKTAIVRQMPRSFANCLKQEVPFDPINVDLAKVQHDDYVDTLRMLVDRVVELPADERLPDCCFIEDAAVVVGKIAAVSFLGAVERRGEEAAVRQALQSCGIKTFDIQFPGTVDGGDVLTVGNDIFVGISNRTNMDGAKQLARIFPEHHVKTVTVEGALHLKSVLSHFDSHTLLIGQSKIAQRILRELDEKYNIRVSYEIVELPDDIAANVLSVGSTVMMQAGFKRSEEILKTVAARKNKKLMTLPMSELIKADGALTCCSILFQDESHTLRP